jgi:hypothetical protein
MESGSTCRDKVTTPMLCTGKSADKVVTTLKIATWHYVGERKERRKRQANNEQLYCNNLQNERLKEGTFAHV